MRVGALDPVDDARDRRDGHQRAPPPVGLDANDADAELDAMTRWFAEHLGPDVPLHFTAFHPDYRLTDRPTTPPATLRRARQIARRNGLRHVYVGNVHDSEGDTTYCHKCHEPLIVRDWYELLRWNIKDGKCPKCGTACAGVACGDGVLGARAIEVVYAEDGGGPTRPEGTALDRSVQGQPDRPGLELGPVGAVAADQETDSVENLQQLLLEAQLQLEEGAITDEAFAEVELNESRGSDSTKPFVFPAINRPLEDGKLYTLDLCPNEWYAYWCAQVVNGLCSGSPNTLYDRLVSPPPPGDGGGSAGQKSFLTGLDAFRQAVRGLGDFAAE